MCDILQIPFVVCRFKIFLLVCYMQFLYLYMVVQHMVPLSTKRTIGIVDWAHYYIIDILIFVFHSDAISYLSVNYVFYEPSCAAIDIYIHIELWYLFPTLDYIEAIVTEVDFWSSRWMIYIYIYTCSSIWFQPIILIGHYEPRLEIKGWLVNLNMIWPLENLNSKDGCPFSNINVQRNWHFSR